MSFPVDVGRLQQLGIGSPYASIDELFIPSADMSRRVLNHTKVFIPFLDSLLVIWNTERFQERMGINYGGIGFDVHLVPTLLPALWWLIAFMLVRYLCREPLGRFGMFLGIGMEEEEQKEQRVLGWSSTRSLSSRSRKKIFKFQNQLWLALFYVASTAFGYMVQVDKPWFGLPMKGDQRLHVLLPHPHNPSRMTVVYYQYQFGFYLSELISLLVVECRVKRSDFVEYVVHHCATIALIFFSYACWEHRCGVYVLFIHDASDIMLCVSKSIHYVITSNITRAKRHVSAVSSEARGQAARRHARLNHANTVCFCLFVTGFFYFRLYCLPVLIYSTFVAAPMLRHGNVVMRILACLLGVLQALHVYWATLIVNIALTTALGGTLKDSRSDDDISEDVLTVQPSGANGKSLRTHNGVKAE